MAWHSTGTENPGKSGSFVVSVLLSRQFGQSAFKYVAFYDKEKNAWYKQDNFSGKDGLGEEITKEVKGWLDDEWGVLLR